MNQIKIGAYIAKNRKEKELTQVQLAEKLGVSDKSVSKWERGVCLPDVSLFQEICDVLGITINEFFAGEDLSDDRVMEQANRNIIAIARDGKERSGKLKKIIAALTILALVLACAGGWGIKNLVDNGYFDKNYVRPYTIQGNAQVIQKLVSPFSSNIGVFEFDNSAGARKLCVGMVEYNKGKKVVEEEFFSIPASEVSEGLIGINLNRETGDYVVSTADQDESIGSMSSTLDLPSKNSEPGLCTAMSMMASTSIVSGEVIPVFGYYWSEEELSAPPIEDVFYEGIGDRSIDYYVIFTVTFK